MSCVAEQRDDTQRRLLSGNEELHDTGSVLPISGAGVLLHTGDQGVSQQEPHWVRQLEGFGVNNSDYCLQV